MSFDYKKIRRRRLKYNVELKSFLIDAEEAKALDKKLVEAKHRTKNFTRGIRKAVRKG